MAMDDHRHCKVCGKMTAAGSETCSRECAAVRESRVRSRRNLQYMLYAVIALVVVLLLSSYIA
jgi:predicted nucleic acid-binding Zn ribbon protein